MSRGREQIDERYVAVAEEEWEKEVRPLLEKEYEKTLGRLIMLGERLYGMGTCVHCGLLCDQANPGDKGRYLTLYWSCEKCGSQACTACVFSWSPYGRRTLEWSPASASSEDDDCGRGLVLPCSLCNEEGAMMTCFDPELRRLYRREPAVRYPPLGKRKLTESIEKDGTPKRQCTDESRPSIPMSPAPDSPW